MEDLLKPMILQHRTSKRGTSHCTKGKKEGHIGYSLPEGGRKGE